MSIMSILMRIMMIAAWIYTGLPYLQTGKAVFLAASGLPLVYAPQRCAPGLVVNYVKNNGL
jgi:hypothetical protein